MGQSLSTWKSRGGTSLKLENLSISEQYFLEISSGVYTFVQLCFMNEPCLMLDWGDDWVGRVFFMHARRLELDPQSVLKKKISSVVVYREEGTGRSLRFTGYPALPNWRDPVSKNKVNNMWDMMVNIDIWLSHSRWTPVHAHFPHTYIHTCRHTHAHTNNKQEGSNEVKSHWKLL